MEGETQLNLPQKVYWEARKSVHDPPLHIGPTSPDNLENLPNFLVVASFPSRGGRGGSDVVHGPRRQNGLPGCVKLAKLFGSCNSNDNCV